MCVSFAVPTSNQPSRYPCENLRSIFRDDEDHLDHRFDSQDADWAAYGLPNYSKLTGQESLGWDWWDDVCPDSIWKQILSTSCLEVKITMRWVVGTWWLLTSVETSQILMPNLFFFSSHFCSTIWATTQNMHKASNYTMWMKDSRVVAVDQDFLMGHQHVQHHKGTVARCRINVPSLSCDRTSGVWATLGGAHEPPNCMVWNELPGWWFGTSFIFPHLGNNHSNWLIFFRGVETTNQSISADFTAVFLLVLLKWVGRSLDLMILQVWYLQIGRWSTLQQRFPRILPLGSTWVVFSAVNMMNLSVSHGKTWIEIDFSMPIKLENDENGPE